MSQFGLLGLCEVITLCSNLRLGWGRKQTYSSLWELSNGVSHFTFTHWGWVDSLLLVVRSQTANLTLGHSFAHNWCCKCPNVSCDAIFYIYTSVPFQWYEEHIKARCFDPCNRALKFWESRRTPKPPFWGMWVSIIFTLSQKVGLRHFKFWQKRKSFAKKRYKICQKLEV